MKRASFAMLRLLPVAIVAGFATPVLAAGLPMNSFPVEQGGQIGFLMPSNNVECIYTPEGGGANYTPEDGGPELSCDRLAPTYLRFVLGAKGPANVIQDVGDQSCCGGTNYFAYGTQWRQAPFTCESSASGLNCRRDDGHGFFISKAKIKSW